MLSPQQVLEVQEGAGVGRPRFAQLNQAALQGAAGVLRALPLLLL